MSEPGSTKPYLMRAMYEWCVDNGLTPHLAVRVDARTRVPLAFVKDGEIVLNINYSATKGLLIDNEAVTFSARFGGVAHDIYVPIACVSGIFARESGQGMFFDLVEQQGAEEAGSMDSPSARPDEEPPPASPSGKPTLKLVK